MDAEWRRIAAYVLCRDDAGRILLTRFTRAGHPDSGKWTMPGGAMEWGEDPFETAERELEEETGLHAEIGRVVGVFSRWYEPHEAVSGNAGHVVGIVYEGTTCAASCAPNSRVTPPTPRMPLPGSRWKRRARSRTSGW